MLSVDFSNPKAGLGIVIFTATSNRINIEEIVNTSHEISPIFHANSYKDSIMSV
jgi:hypothetical protein